MTSASPESITREQPLAGRILETVIHRDDVSPTYLLWGPEGLCKRAMAQWFATALVCAGPIGWLGLAGFSIASAYSKANQQATSTQRTA